MTQFFDLPIENPLVFIRRADDRFDVSDMIIEKDLWICWLLEQLFSLPIKMAFKGGTSLSKVFGLIKRFSEHVSSDEPAVRCRWVGQVLAKF